MQAWLSFVRTTFLVLGVLEILSAAALAVKVLARPPQPEAGIPVWFLFLVCAVLAAFGALSCLCAHMMAKPGRRFARLVVGFNSFLHLPALPFGTIAGVVGLYWCWSARARQTEVDGGEFAYQSTPGDGTHPWVQKAAVVIGIAMWVIAFEATDWWGAAHRLPAQTPAGGILLLFGCNFVHVFLHELGHAVAGWSSNMKLSSFAVGPFLGEKRNGRWRCRFSVLTLLAGGGSVSMSPLDLRDLRSRMAFHVAGGPAASFAVAVSSFTCLLGMPGSGWEMWWQVPATMAAISGSTLLFNLIPFGAAAGFSDGAALVQLMRGGPYARYREAMAMVAATTVSGLRPGELDPGRLARGLRIPGMGMKGAVAQLIEVMCATDRGDLRLAKELLENGLTQMGNLDQFDDPATVAEVAFYVAFVTGDMGRAQYWLGRAEHLAKVRKFPLAAEFDYWKAVAIIRQGQGRTDEAEEAWQQTMKLATPRPRSGLYDFEYETLRQVREGRWVLPQPEAAAS
ncbi:MAG: M50 family metallopeptidase [Bryobacterales bacterium]|nr:M50 family metallopeptidase [Bryobacterales bacterium]